MLHAGGVTGRRAELRLHAARWWRTFAANERGDSIMLEATIIVPPLLALMLFFWGAYTRMYTKWNMETLAHDTAARVGQCFRYYYNDIGSIDLKTGAMEVETVGKSDPFRYYHDRGNRNLEAVAAVVEPGVTEYLLDTNVGLLSRRDVSILRDDSVSVDVIDDGIARHHIVVTINATYALPFGHLMAVLSGADSDYNTLSATAYADCLDLGDYIVTTEYVRSMSEKLHNLLGSSLTGGGRSAVGKRAVTIQQQMINGY